MKWLILLAALLAVLLGGIWLLSETTLGFGIFLGRFHSLLVHFPIVLVLLAALLEFLPGGRERSPMRAILSPLLVLAAGSACVAALTGFLLSYEGGFAEDVIEWHERLGIFVALLMVTAFVFRTLDSVGRRRWMALTYRSCLGAAVLAIGITGHLGGVLAHGPDYLTEHLPSKVRQAFGISANSNLGKGLDRETSTIFEGLVDPVLRANCLECHSETRRRGGLSLTGVDAIRAGGENGPIVVPGDSQASELVRRITLPPGDEDRMPPGNRAPLAIGSIELIRWWIEEGAAEDRKIGEARDIPFPVQVHLDRVAGPRGRRVPAPGVGDLPPPDPNLLTGLEAQGFGVAFVAEGSPLLSVRLPAGRTLGKEQVEALLPLASHVFWLDLSAVSLQEGSADLFSRLENVARLNLSRSNVGDDDLRYLNRLPKLEYLNLYATGIGDAGLAHLEALESLRSLYLWQTAVSEQGASALAARLPACRIDRGVEQQDVESRPVDSPDQGPGD